MALVVRDRVRVTTTTTGTGTITLGAATTGFQSFSVIGNGNTTYYAIIDVAAGTWEVGVGTYTASGNTLSRDTVLDSSNAGSLVDFAAGAKDVICTQPAERAVLLDSATNATVPGITLSGGTANGVAYLNGSKVLTSGSALTFDGTTLTANTLSLTNALAIANGGTGATTAATALTNLGAYAATNPNGYITTPFPVGTVMLFAQTAAPTGWTKNITHDNKALRVVSGTASSGGSVAFTTAFASQSIAGTVGDTTLTSSQIPAHNHGVNDPGHGHGVNDPGHNHSMRYGTPNGDFFGMNTGAGEGGWALANGPGNNNITRLYNNGSGTGIGIFGSTTGITTANTGGGASHNHTFSGTAINLAVQYVDVIIATKD